MTWLDVLGALSAYHATENEDYWSDCDARDEAQYRIGKMPTA
jgi:hypothetical protein